MRASLSGEVVSVAAEQFTVRTDDGQELRVSHPQARQRFTEHGRVTVTVQPEEEAALERDDLARTLLTQVLSPLDGTQEANTP